LVVAPLLAGCGSDAGNGVVLSFYTPADGSEQYAAAAASCTTAAAGRYRIEQRTLPRNADDQRLQLARRLAGNDRTLDLMALDVVWTAEFAAAGWALPLPDDVAARVSRGTLAGPLATARWQQRLYAAPLNSNTQLLWYRKDLMPDGQPPRTWEQMLDIARGLAAAHRPAGIEVQAKQYEGLMVWFNTLLVSAGGGIVGPDGATVTLDHGSAARTALALMKRVATAPGHDPSFDQLDETLARSSMEDGNAAFELNWPFVLPGIRTDAAAGGVASIDSSGNPTSARTGNTVLSVNGQQNFLPAPFPAVVAGHPAKVTIGGFNIAAAKTSRHPDLAFQAMECLRDSENERNNGIYGGMPPTLSALYDDPDFQAAYPMWRQVRDGLSDAAVRPVSPAYQSISTLLTAKLNPVGDIDPDTAVPVLAQQVRNAVDSQGLVP
jgi:multiple sugar transport system substrate-binding protein